jgi:hypothetical protein
LPNCICDPSAVGSGYLITAGESCENFGCWLYDLFTVLAFSFVFLYGVLVLFLISRESIKWIESRKISVLIIMIGCILRIAYYSIMMDQSLLVQEANNSSFISFVNFLFSIALCFGYIVFSFLAFSWVRLYHQIIKPNTSNDTFSIANWLEKHQLWITSFYVANTTGMGIYLVLFTIQSLLNIWSIGNYWFGVMEISLCLFIFIYGRRITKSLMNITGSISVDPSRIKRFRKIQFFTYTVAIIIIIGILFIIIETVSFIWITTIKAYLIKESIGRLIELAMAIALLMSMQPPLRLQSSSSHKKQSTNQSNNL